MLLGGCGGGGGSTPPPDTTQTAYLIDSAVEGIDYTCGTLTGTTDATGKFTYDTAKCASVEFKLGNLSLGSINPTAINSDTYLTLQELAGTTREDITNGTVQKMAVLLQSLDDDSDASNGIKINSTTRTNFALTGNLADKTDNEISTEITARGKTQKDKIQALNHLLASTKTIASSTKIDFTPNTFSFTDLINQAKNTQLTSNEIIIGGIDIPTIISITNGEYKIGIGAWTSANGTITNGQTVTLRGTTPDAFDSTKNITLTIGGVSDIFTIATTGNTIPNPFDIANKSNVALSTLIESDGVTIAGLTTASSISVTDGEYSINGGAYTATAGTISNGQTVKVRHTSSASNATPTTTTLTIGGVSDTFTATTLTDTIPNTFSFTDVSNIALSTLIESNEITVSGLAVASPISITDGEYSINGGTYTATAGTISNGQTVKVRHTSSGSNATPTTTTLTIGGISDTFTATTLADTIPTAFSFTDVSNIPLATLIESNEITVSGLAVTSPISVTGGEYKIGTAEWTSANGTVSNNDTVKVRHTSSVSSDTNITTTLTIGGISDGFTTTTLPIPTITFNPSSGTTDVGIYTWIQIDFNEDMNNSTILPALTLSGGKTLASCDYNTTTQSALCKLTDNGTFASNTLYTLTGTVKNSTNQDRVVDMNFTTGSLNTFGRLRTGQTTSYVDYDDAWYVTNQNLGLARSFDRNATSGQETVKDNVTKLIWQDDSSASSVTATWENANSTTCQNLNTSSFGGYTDWRLPTIEELYTITNKGAYNPSKFTEFSNFASNDYWSSTSYAGSTDYAWLVGFTSGVDAADYKTYSYYVRCVRAGQ